MLLLVVDELSGGRRTRKSDISAVYNAPEATLLRRISLMGGHSDLETTGTGLDSHLARHGFRPSATAKLTLMIQGTISRLSGVVKA